MIENQQHLVKEPITDLITVLDKVERYTLDTATYFDHLHAGTLHLYYVEILNDIITDLVTIPVERTCLGLEPVESPDDVIKGCNEIASMLAVTFNKTDRQVHDEMMTLMNEFPVEDMRTARVKKRKGLLH
jgi:hypothetical protein